MVKTKSIQILWSESQKNKSSKHKEMKRVLRNHSIVIENNILDIYDSKDKWIIIIDIKELIIDDYIYIVGFINMNQLDNSKSGLYINDYRECSITIKL